VKLNYKKSESILSSFLKSKGSIDRFLETMISGDFSIDNVYPPDVDPPGRKPEEDKELEPSKELDDFIPDPQYESIEDEEIVDNVLLENNENARNIIEQKSKLASQSGTITTHHSFEKNEEKEEMVDNIEAPKMNSKYLRGM